MRRHHPALRRHHPALRRHHPAPLYIKLQKSSRATPYAPTPSKICSFVYTPTSPAAPQAPPPTPDPPVPPPRRHPHPHQTRQSRPPTIKSPPTTTQAPQSNKNPGRAMLDPGHTRKSRRNYLVPRRISAFTSARASSKVGPSLSPRCQKSQPSLSIPKLCAAKSGSSKTRPSTVMRPSVPKVP